MTTVQEDKAVGALVASAIGDSLGAPAEFMPPRPEPEWIREMIGGGVLRWQPGDITDDTIMSLAIQDMYLAKNGYDQKYLIDKWLEWRSGNPKDMGRWTGDTLGRWNRNIKTGELRGDDNPAIALWKARGARDAGNGGVMRCMPTAIFEPDQNKRISDTIKICQDTHPDPRCIHSCIAVVEAISAMVENPSMTKNAVLDHVIQLLGPNPTEVGEALEIARTNEIQKCANSGYTVDTVKCAFTAFMQAKDLESGLIEIVNRGNDADTVGAVAGSLLGAFYGFKSIPARWFNKLKRGREIEDNARKLFKLGRLKETLA